MAEPCQSSDCALLHDNNGYHANKGWARGARPCDVADCGLLHDAIGCHAAKGWARGPRRALFHHTGECSAWNSVQHHAADCPLLTPEEIALLKAAADTTMRRDGWLT